MPNERSWGEEEINKILSDVRCDHLDGWCTHIGAIKRVVAEVAHQERERIKKILRNGRKWATYVDVDPYEQYNQAIEDALKAIEE